MIKVFLESLDRVLAQGIITRWICYYIIFSFETTSNLSNGRRSTFTFRTSSIRPTFSRFSTTFHDFDETAESHIDLLQWKLYGTNIYSTTEYSRRGKGLNEFSLSLSVLQLLFPLCVAVFPPAFILAVNPLHLWTLSPIFETSPRRGPELRAINEVYFSLFSFLFLPFSLTHSISRD